jgi:mRNA-degrading endonuclease RelE of RelBE toxin-antitoxin system
MVNDPFACDVLKLEGEDGLWRRSVGSYRIFFTVNAKAKAVVISAIVRRTPKTY